MGVKYYKDLFEITDSFRKMKYEKLLLASMQNDIRKWTETVKEDRVIYHSPSYGGSTFSIEVRSYFSFAFITHTTPIIAGQNSELINDHDTQTKDFKTALQNLRMNIFTPEIYEIEKSIGNQHNRKEKLDALELQQIKTLVDETYEDWTNNGTEIVASLIAKIIYSYRMDKELYELWTEKFDDIELVMSELKKLKG